MPAKSGLFTQSNPCYRSLEMVCIVGRETEPRIHLTGHLAMVGAMIGALNGPVSSMVGSFLGFFGEFALKMSALHDWDAMYTEYGGEA